MSSDIGKRLKDLRIDSGFKSARDAAKRFGWNENTYRSHENSSRGVPRESLLEYARAFRTSVTWLLTGNEEHAATGPVLGVSVPILDWSDLPVEWNKVSLQIITRKAARSVVYVGDDDGKFIAVAAPDESMIPEHISRHAIYPGDILIVAVTAKVSPNKNVLLWDTETQEHCIRRAQFKSRHTITFTALNPAFPPITLPANSPNILGVIVSIQRAM